MTLAAQPLAAQTPREIPSLVTIDQNAIMRQYGEHEDFRAVTPAPAQDGLHCHWPVRDTTAQTVA